MKVGGYAGQVCVDLTKEITKEPWDLDAARKHLGGFELQICVDLLNPKRSHSPENIIFMGMGPMFGTAEPQANKNSVMTNGLPRARYLRNSRRDFGINVKLSG
jgi:aldehyde:ferredoxin oxidoreductase